MKLRDPKELQPFIDWWADETKIGLPITAGTRKDVLFILGALQTILVAARVGEIQTADDAIAILNSIHAADPTVLPRLIGYRVPCNEELAAHPTVQVGKRDGTGEYEVGILGILNGLFGIQSDGYGRIAASFEQGELKGFGRWVPPPDFKLNLSGLTEEGS